MSPWHPLCIPFYHHFCSGWWLVVSTPLKNISRLGLLFHILWKNNIWNHQPVVGEMPKKSWFYPIIGQLEVWRSCLPKGRKVTEKVMRWTKSSTIIGHGLLLGLPVYQIHNWNIFEAVFGFEAARSYTLYQDLPLEQWHTHTWAKYHTCCCCGCPQQGSEANVQKIWLKSEPRLLFCTIIVTAKKSAKGCCRANIRVWEHVLRAVATSGSWKNVVKRPLANFQVSSQNQDETPKKGIQ